MNTRASLLSLQTPRIQHEFVRPSLLSSSVRPRKNNAKATREGGYAVCCPKDKNVHEVLTKVPIKTRGVVF